MFRSDNGGEYINQLMAQYFTDNGIIHETTTPYTPQQNGISELKMRTIFERVRTMMYRSGAPDCLWNFAADYVAICLNTTLIREHEGVMYTPYELLMGVKPNWGQLYVFGCNVSIHLPVVHN
jgi:hypothetical protein